MDDASTQELYGTTLHPQRYGGLIIKPCPFCAGEVGLQYLYGSTFDEGWYVVCENCNLSIIYAREDNIKLYNSRPAEAALRKALQEIRDAYLCEDYPAADHAKLEKIWLIANRALKGKE